MNRVLRFTGGRLRGPARHPLILMYHRVTDAAVDPWGLAVSPGHFEAHLALLRRRMRPLGMVEFVQKLEHGSLPANAVAVTFDDGYSDNLRVAKPLLEAAGVQATLFLTTATVGSRSGYWWDELARAILRNPNTVDRDIPIGDEPFRLSFSADADTVPVDARWRAWEPARSAREAAYLAIWRRLREMPRTARDATINRLRQAVAAPPPEPDELPMTTDEIAKLTAGGTFELGAHTASHPVLPTLDSAERRREIREGREACERIAKVAVEGFSYPHGAVDADCAAAVKECGFRWACATGDRAISASGFDRFSLPRVYVPDCDGSDFERLLQCVPA